MGAPETVNVNMPVDKDAKEVIDVIAKIEKHFLQKKPWSELLATLPDAIGAVDGWENMVAAVKGTGLGEAAGYAVWQILEPFEKAPVAAETPAS